MNNIKKDFAMKELDVNTLLNDLKFLKSELIKIMDKGHPIASDLATQIVKKNRRLFDASIGVDKYGQVVVDASLISSIHSEIEERGEVSVLFKSESQDKEGLKRLSDDLLSSYLKSRGIE